MIRISIKNPAPLGVNLEKWGDYHFGCSLAEALEARGAEVVQHFWPEWDKDDNEDLVIVLRGKRLYIPPKNKLSLMWVISHPATVLADEMRLYDLVYVASETHYNMVRNDASINVDIARQCTDTRAFRFMTTASDRRGVTFVANSRGVRRDILSWAISTDVRVSIVGRHWNAFGLKHLVQKDYISNNELPAFYGGSRLTLNDHWGDMAYFGYINNRIFDSLACGTPILSDTFPELQLVCGSGILYAEDATSFWEAYKTYLLRYPDILERTERLWGKIRDQYGFDNRAEQILNWLGVSCAPRKRGTLVGCADGVFSSLMSKIVEVLRERGVSRDLQCLHLFPTPEHTAQLVRNENFSYISAGTGRGAWHVCVDTEMSRFVSSQYDVIIVDEVLTLQALSQSEIEIFWKAVISKLSAKGILVAPKEVLKKNIASSCSGRALLPEPWMLIHADS